MTVIEIREYLENFQDKKVIAEYKKQQGITADKTVRQVAAIENCLQVLPDGLGDILRMLYWEGKSLREISQRHYYSKNTVARKRDKAIEIMASCLSEL